MATHRLEPTAQTVRWGTFDAGYPPLITINSGDTVVLECVSGGPEVMPPPESGLRVPPALAAIHAANIRRVGGHILTGPVAVTGAEPGDMLEVHIDKIEFGADWGYCGFRPLLGTLPEDFPERFLSHIPIDPARRMAKLPWGTELPLAPFFGVMGVAPPRNYGTISTKEPREHGGNLDNKELSEGRDPIPARVGTRGTVLGRRRAWRAGRRRGLYQCAGNLPDWHVHIDPGQGRRRATRC
jgi:acetamidase/formamidase